MSALPVPTLTTLVFAPATAALLVAVLPESRARLRRGLALLAAFSSFAMAATIALDRRAAGTIRDSLLERYSWIPSFGASYELGLDGLSILLAAWVTLLALVALLSERAEAFDRSTTALVLCFESALLGLFLARDVYLLLAFLGAAVASLALLLGQVSPLSMRKFFGCQAVGLVLLFGLAAGLSHLVYVQTGFASGELARWTELVIYPGLESRYFLLGAAATAVLAPQLPALLWLGGALRSLTTPGRILVTGGYSLVGGYLLFRFVLPIVPRGAEKLSAWLLALALLGLLFVAASSWRSDGTSPPWNWLLVAYQSLVLVGLAALRDEGLAAGLVLLLHQAAALTALVLSTDGAGEVELRPAKLFDKALMTLTCASLLAVPSVVHVVSGQWTRSWFVAVAASSGAVVLAVKIVRGAPSWSRRDHSWTSRRRAVLIPVLAYCIWLATSSHAWELRFRDVAQAVVAPLSGGNAPREADP